MMAAGRAVDIKLEHPEPDWLSDINDRLNAEIKVLQNKRAVLLESFKKESKEYFSNDRFHQFIAEYKVHRQHDKLSKNDSKDQIRQVVDKEKEHYYQVAFDLESYIDRLSKMIKNNQAYYMASRKIFEMQADSFKRKREELVTQLVEWKEKASHPDQIKNALTVMSKKVKALNGSNPNFQQEVLSLETEFIICYAGIVALKSKEKVGYEVEFRGSLAQLAKDIPEKAVLQKQDDVELQEIAKKINHIDLIRLAKGLVEETERFQTSYRRFLQASPMQQVMSEDIVAVEGLSCQKVEEKEWLIIKEKKNAADKLITYYSNACKLLEKITEQEYDCVKKEMEKWIAQCLDASTQLKKALQSLSVERMVAETDRTLDSYRLAVLQYENVMRECKKAEETCYRLEGHKELIIEQYDLLGKKYDTPFFWSEAFKEAADNDVRGFVETIDLANEYIQKYEIDYRYQQLQIKIEDLFNILREAIISHLDFWHEQVFFYSRYSVHGISVPYGIQRMYDEVTEQKEIREKNALPALKRSPIAKLEILKEVAKSRITAGQEGFFVRTKRTTSTTDAFYSLIANLDDGIFNLNEEIEKKDYNITDSIKKVEKAIIDASQKLEKIDKRLLKKPDSREEEKERPLMKIK